MTERNIIACPKCSRANVVGNTYCCGCGKRLVPSRSRGFAAMDPAKVREISRKGGISAHRSGVAHEFSSAEARIAGRKGGLATRKKLEELRSSPPTESQTIDEEPTVE